MIIFRRSSSSIGCIGAGQPSLGFSDAASVAEFETPEACVLAGRTGRARVLRHGRASPAARAVTDGGPPPVIVTGM